MGKCKRPQKVKRKGNERKGKGKKESHEKKDLWNIIKGQERKGGEKKEEERRRVGRGLGETRERKKEMKTGNGNGNGNRNGEICLVISVPRRVDMKVV